MQDPTLTDFYDRNFAVLGDYFSVHRERFLQSWAYLQHHGLSQSRTVLDIGGIGPLSSFMKEQGAAEIFETKTDLRGALNLEPEYFDLVICTETIEHIKDVDSNDIRDLESFNFSGVANMLGELYGACRPGGAVFITTPNANSYITLHKWLQGDALMMDPNHVREFTVKDLCAAGLRAGFHVDAIETRNTWTQQFGEPVAELAASLKVLVKSSHVERGDNIFAIFRK